MDFAHAIRTLSDGGVDFIVIGGVSASLHGSARLTFDLDVFYCRTAENVKRLAEVLKPFHPRPRGFPPDLPFVWDAATIWNCSVLTLDTDVGSIDLLAEVAGLGTYAEVKSQAVRMESAGREVYILDLPALIRTKRAAGREKDLAAIPELEALLEARGE